MCVAPSLFFNRMVSFLFNYYLAIKKTLDVLIF